MVVRGIVYTDELGPGNCHCCSSMHCYPFDVVEITEFDSFSQLQSMGVREMLW